MENIDISLRNIEGTLDAWFETGCEGIYWTLYEKGKQGYGGLNIIEEGDYLTIFSKEKQEKEKKKIIGEGEIIYDKEINMAASLYNSEYH